MRDFEREFHVENVIRLEQNYRSHGNPRGGQRHHQEQPRAAGQEPRTDAGAGEPIRVFEGFSDLDEARFIVDEAGI